MEGLIHHIHLVRAMERAAGLQDVEELALLYIALIYATKDGALNVGNTDELKAACEDFTKDRPRFDPSDAAFSRGIAKVAAAFRAGLLAPLFDDLDMQINDPEYDPELAHQAFIDAGVFSLEDAEKS